ncbi:MAG: glycosyltransferase [Pseudomonadota bacterium]
MTAATPHRVSIVFRALNEEKWFAQALSACWSQDLTDIDLEIVLVDSGSTDRTLEIAESFGCKIEHIPKSEFTFGRSLNRGCAAASGDHLVFISAHCIPAHENWLQNLLAPLLNAQAQYVYGKQIGHDVTRFSEHQIFAQYFPDQSKISSTDFFANNANSALSTAVWRKTPFDENVTGLEDMVLGKEIVRQGGAIAYVADAPVIHIHEESLSQVKRRYYREALTLREIMPEVHFNFGDFVRYFTAGVLHDFSEALTGKEFFGQVGDIMAFRLMQYWGSYRGHNEHRKLSRAQKERYYYPKAYKGGESSGEKTGATLTAPSTIAK